MKDDRDFVLISLVLFFFFSSMPTAAILFLHTETIFRLLDDFLLALSFRANVLYCVLVYVHRYFLLHCLIFRRNQSSKWQAICVV